MSEEMISVSQFNYAVEMLTDKPSNAAIDAYRNDPFVYRMVHCIKAVIAESSPHGQKGE